MVDNLNHISDDEESELSASLDPSLLDESNEEKQLDNQETPPFSEVNRSSNTTTHRFHSDTHTSVTQFP